jgi:endonuclease YncB( thermonuclease family)
MYSHEIKPPGLISGSTTVGFRKDVTVQTYGHDKYKRTLADVLLPDGTNVNRTLVKNGW